MRIAVADLGHVWLHLEAKTRPVSAHEYRLLVAETLRGRVLAAIADEGTPCAMGGVLDVGDGGPGAAWLSVVAGGLGSRLLFVSRLMRRVLAQAAPGFPRGLVAIVDDDNTNGRRLAAALGFIPADLAFGSSRRWVLDHGRHRRHDHGAGAARADEPRAVGPGRAARGAGEAAIQP